jgi:hypothetical protein
MGHIRAAIVAGLMGVCALAATGAVLAQEREVALAGVAYAGDAQTILQRFPYSNRYEQGLRDAGDTSFKRVLAAVQQVPASSLRYTTQQLDELKGRDQALVVTLLLNAETVSVERFGDVRKLFILIRGQALFFDFKSMAVVRAYPLSFAYIDNFRREPSEDEILARVKAVYEGVSGKPGLFARFANTLAAATVPTQTPRFLRVTKVSMPAEMVASLPESLKATDGVYKTWAADMVGEALSTRVGVPIVPFIEGMAINNVMAMRISGGDVYTLALPAPDYAISVDFKGLKKVKYSESGAGASFVYGAFADIRIEEPLSNTVYLNTALKNAEVKVVPATQTYVDDFPAFADSLNGMFMKLGDAIAGKGNTWVKAAAGAQDIEAQILKTKDLMNLCK